MARPATPRLSFEASTSLLVSAIADTCLQYRNRLIRSTGGTPVENPDDQQWFFEHCDRRVRYMHANNIIKFGSLAKRTDNKFRDTVITWVSHWAQAFSQNPTSYRAKHPHEAMSDGKS